jgi:hypothetical protein
MIQFFEEACWLTRAAGDNRERIPHVGDTYLEWSAIDSYFQALLATAMTSMQTAVAIDVDRRPSSGTAYFLVYKNLRKSFRLWLLRQSSMAKQMTASIDFRE